MSDIQTANDLNIRVYGFETRPEPAKDANGKPTGEIVMRDYVKYGPPLAADRLVVEARVERLLKAPRPVNGNNIAENAAYTRAQFIRPLYEAWKRGEELPETGTPLAACNFLRAEDVAVLKMAGVRTAEELAGMLDTNLAQVKLPQMREKRAQAKRFLEAQDTNKAAAKLAAQSEEIAELKAQMQALMAAKNAETEDVPDVDENGDRIPKRRGRPPKVDTQEQSEAA